MTLYTQLQTTKSEEDIKVAYIKALGLKGCTKGRIGIQTNETWFEAKDTGRNPIAHRGCGAIGPG